MIFQRLWAVVGVAVVVSACQVKPNKGETTPPTITITLMDKLGNQPSPFTPATTYNSKYVLSGNNYIVTVDPNLDILITISAKDPGGMNTLTGSIWYFANCGQGVGGGVTAALTDIKRDGDQQPAQHGHQYTALPLRSEVSATQDGAISELLHHRHAKWAGLSRRTSQRDQSIQHFGKREGVHPHCGRRHSAMTVNVARDSFKSYSESQEKFEAAPE